MSKIPKPMKSGSSDIFYTPEDVVVPLFNYIPKGQIIWECACGIGSITDLFIKRGYKVKWSDISRDPKEDFLTYQPKQWDVIVTNPPFSIKDKFLKRAYSLGKPFAFLLPVTALGGQHREVMYKQYGIQLILLGGRTNFMAEKNAP